jgi:pimeloyl-ACP methyl ester carboxylesterase
MRSGSIIEILAFFAVAVQAQIPYQPNTCRSTPSDTTFLPSSFTGGAGGPDTLCNGAIGGPCQTITETFNITRVVGPGQAPYTNSNGTLVNPDAYVANGIVSQYANLQIFWDAGFSYNTDFHFTINGQSIPGGDISVVGVGSSFPYTVSGPSAPSNVAGTLCLKVPIEYIRFATRNVGGAPTPGVNQIQVYSTNPNALATDDTEAMAGAGSLSFEAMAPIILVHGINANQSWFMTNGFIAPWDAANVPYAVATANGETSLDPGTISETGQTLVSRIPALAGEFGATKVHIVAHSKGGLWSRYFLKYGPLSIDTSVPPTPNNFGVLSLTTLDTPNNGSILADVAVESIDVTSLLAIASGPEAEFAFYIALQFASGELDQITDLTRAAVEGFNSQTGEPPDSFEDIDGSTFNIYYRAVAADADIGDKTDASGNRYVDATDCAGMSVFGNQINANACKALYQILGNEDNLYNLSSSLPFDLNDMLVTQNSAKVLNYVDGSTPYSVPLLVLDPLRKNHSTVGDSSVSCGGASCTTGSGVLGVIQQIQPVEIQPAQ